MRKNKYILANSLNLAKAEANTLMKEGYKIVAIEAEYGDKDLSDVISIDESLSHHGPRHQNTPPCMRWDLYGKYKTDTAFIFSHLDADSVLGLMICEGVLPKGVRTRTICDIIGHIDIHGPHKAHEHPDYVLLKDIVLSIIQIISEERGQYHQPNSSNSLSIDYTIFNIKNRILGVLKNGPDEEALKRIKDQEREAYNALDKSFSIQNLLHTFIAHRSYSYKYVIEDENFISNALCTLQYNTKFKSVTLACVDEETAKRLFGEDGVVGILKEYFGEESGGRISIGGSPRGKEIAYNDFVKFVNVVKEILQKENVDENLSHDRES